MTVIVREIMPIPSFLMRLMRVVRCRISITRGLQVRARHHTLATGFVVLMAQS